MTDILLIQPPIRDFYLTAKRTVPYGLTCIASALMRDGFSVEILDGLATSKSRMIPWPEEMNHLRKYYGKPDFSPFALFHHFKHFGYSFERLGKLAGESEAFLIGISSLFTAYSDEAIKTAEAVRRFHPDCKIVLGGHHPTAMPEEVMKNQVVDFVIRGEGEISMPLLARTLQNGGSPDSIPGIVFRNQDGTLTIRKPAMSDHLDDYPLPAAHLLKHSFYKRGTKGSTVVVTSRGCPMRCTYCSLGTSSPIKYRRRSVDSVIREIENALTQHNAGFIDFEDENLSMEREWFLDLMHRIKNRFGAFRAELRAMNGLFPPSLDDEMVRLMKETGFKTLNLALGSTSKEQLRRFRRPDVREAFDRALGFAEKHGLEAVGYVIVGGPDQRGEDSVSDLLYLAQRRVLAGVSVFYPSPGSADFEKCARLGILPESFSLMRSTALPLSFITTRDESVTLLRLGRILNFMKSLLDRDLPIPAPLPFKDAVLEDVGDRRETGKRLLQWFLYDGKIRGISPNGVVFEHRIAPELTKQFLNGLQNIKLRGYGTST